MYGSPGHDWRPQDDRDKQARSGSSPSLAERLLHLVKRTPGFVVGVATVISAAAAVIGLVASNSGSAPSPSRSATPSATATTSARAQSAQQPKIYWGPGPLLINNNTDFDLNPPTTSDTAGEVGFGTNNNGALTFGPEYGVEVAPWTGAVMPSPTKCREHALTESKDAVIRAGSDFCVLTAQDRVAFVHVTNIDASVPDAQSITTVWTMPES
jgi:hypothetical protein